MVVCEKPEDARTYFPLLENDPKDLGAQLNSPGKLITEKDSATSKSCI